MKKELLISIIIGFGLGLIITFGIYTGRKALQEQVQILSPFVEDKDESDQKIASQSLSVISPIDQSISKEASINVTGVTSPSSFVMVLTEKGEKIIQSDVKGNFETQITLISGENEIEVHSFSDSGQDTSKTITVVYSTAEI